VELARAVRLAGESRSARAVVTNKEADRISDSEVRTDIYLDRLAHFDGRALEDLQQQITVWQTPEDVCRELPKVEVGAGVCCAPIKIWTGHRGQEA
jgi:hypothetical protein